MTKAKRSRPSARPKRSRQTAGAAPSTRGRSSRPPISTVIFDLDDTLYDCFGQRVQAAHRHAARAMVAAGLPATAEQVFQVRMRAFERDPQLTHIDAEVCHHFGVQDGEAIVRAARLAFFTLPVEKLELFPGTPKVLRELKKCGVRMFVVSFGDPATQRAKVAALGLEREPAIERIFYADTGHVVTKEAVFRSVLRNSEPNPQRVLVVGDRPSSEIRAGNTLGMHTVRLRQGEFARLKPQGPEEQAEFEISKIDAVLHLPFAFGGGRSRSASKA